LNPQGQFCRLTATPVNRDIEPQVRIGLTTFPLPRESTTTVLLRHDWSGYRELNPVLIVGNDLLYLRAIPAIGVMGEN
jgi:hypothetical protein